MKRIGLWVVVGVVIVIAALVVALLSIDTRQDTTIRLDDVDDGVTYRTLGRTSVFLIRSGRNVDVILARSTHLREPLHWCVRERVFYDPRVGGDLFDVRGRKIAGTGPAPRDLDSLTARIDGESVIIRTHPVIAGPDLDHGGGKGVLAPQFSAVHGVECREAIPPR